MSVGNDETRAGVRQKSFLVEVFKQAYMVQKVTVTEEKAEENSFEAIYWVKSWWDVSSHFNYFFLLQQG